ncbi:MAG TPA: HAD-IIIA family hydrolase [Acidimicrobiales bacterium]
MLRVGADRCSCPRTVLDPSMSMMTTPPLTVDVVIPTIGRPSLARLLEALAAASGPRPAAITVVDDRINRPEPLTVGSHREVTVVLGRAAGPASARNIGWRLGSADWVAFLDDDVIPGPRWLDELAADLIALENDVGGSQARLQVPLPTDRRPTDWERNVAGLATARWATADMAYRRSALAAVGGFDERFPRAYREDADLAVRVQAAGFRLVIGARSVSHPVPPAGPFVSVRRQRGNADDALLRALHGRHWRRLAGIPKGRRKRHLVITAAGTAALLGLIARRPTLARAGVVVWGAGTAELIVARIAPGPRTTKEVATMCASSVAIPPCASAHWLAGWATLPKRLRTSPPRQVTRPAAVLFDRDGTLVVDVPYNGDPTRVEAMPTAAEAVAALRAAGIPTAVVSNQSGIARGVVDQAAVDAVNCRIEEVLGPLGYWAICPHGPDDGCGCRKPKPGLIVEAADALGVECGQVAVIGDIGADIVAARTAGARGILVPTSVTRPDEVAAAPEVASDLAAAVRLLLGPA